jgi:GMP synthase (glutamine-hydrolysing)
LQLHTLEPQGPVLVVDFGAQYAQLIARRVREAHVYSEIVPHTIAAAELAAMRPAGIILSGGPKSVNVPDAPLLDPEVYELGVPVLGICTGGRRSISPPTARPRRSCSRWCRRNSTCG